MDNGEQNKKTPILYAVSIFIMVFLGLAVIFSSFVAFSTAEKKKNKDTVSTASIVMTYTEETNGISVNNKLTMNDEIGRKISNVGEYFDFTVTTKMEELATIKAKYEIALIKDSSSNISDNDVRIYLEKKEGKKYIPIAGPIGFKKSEEDSKIGSPAGSMVIHSETVEESRIDKYRLRVWISEKAKDFKDKKYTLKVNIYGKAL